ncbi:hypothetical protein KABACHOK_02700 [Brevundimonas phage vB_BpoS-Kabachok]|uniref:Uncharacterized protein n=1 Tax=Brevundimonas phage vB_BpoS-Kabachok TaxID=2948600 RepID=A0A9E7MQY7_9CAUD|nr:hypothetical protein KABACHOK_02700 [Brevundimonas phage vB_BpoS-Kabachok]
MSEKSRLTVSGRWARSEPVIQNLPGSFADALSWAFERQDFSEVRRRLKAGDLEPRNTSHD